MSERDEMSAVNASCGGAAVYRAERLGLVVFQKCFLLSVIQKNNDDVAIWKQFVNKLSLLRIILQRKRKLVSCVSSSPARARRTHGRCLQAPPTSGARDSHWSAGFCEEMNRDSGIYHLLCLLIEKKPENKNDLLDKQFENSKTSDDKETLRFYEKTGRFFNKKP